MVDKFKIMKIIEEAEEVTLMKALLIFIQMTKENFFSSNKIKLIIINKIFKEIIMMKTNKNKQFKNKME